jgi:hypothetical protein
MQDDLTRAQRYRALAAQMWETAQHEPDENRRKQLIGLADQYSGLADKLIGHQAMRARNTNT